MRRHLHAFMSKQGAGLAEALAPELMHIGEQPEQVKERALDHVAIYIWEAHLACQSCERTAALERNPACKLNLTLRLRRDAYVLSKAMHFGRGVLNAIAS